GGAWGASSWPSSGTGRASARAVGSHSRCGSRATEASAMGATMPARGRWFVTPHALARFRELVPTLSERGALAALIRESERAHLVRVDHETGALLMRGPRPHRLRFVVRPPPEPG